jgi:hypothetical protein
MGTSLGQLVTPAMREHDRLGVVGAHALNRQAVGAPPGLARNEPQNSERPRKSGAFLSTDTGNW